MDPNVLARKQLPELRTMAAELRMRGYQRLRKADLIEAIVKEANRQADPNRRSEVANGSAPDGGADTGDAGGDGRDNGEQLQLDRDDRVSDDDDDAGRQHGDDGDDDGQRRRRRSRRERRRNRGGVGSDDARGQQQSREDEMGETGEIRTGVLDVLPEGYGFLRTTGYLPGDRDAYVSQSTIRKMGLRRGDIVSGPIRQHKSSDKVPALAFVHTVNGVDLSDGGRMPPRPDFKDMTPLFPDERLHLETPGGPISMRIVDLVAPIGKGQRGLIVSPPKAGKTTILKELGQAIIANNPECHLMVVLVDERPEEVTDMQRSVKGEIVASTFDRPADDHTQIAELAMERAKRLVEQGQDVVVLLDSITRLARAYNLSAPASGRIMSGGVDSTALYPPKRFFGAARNIEEGGSLTIIATALIETGSKMDEVIFEEFKGTGNMELRLDRRMEQKRIFPAIDIDASGTRKEELLFDPEELAIVWKLRRVLAALEGPAALELLIDKMKATRSNNQFLTQIQSSNLQT
jgi:transcription termination factor Rho